MSVLTFDKVAVRFATRAGEPAAISGLSMALGSGEFVVVVGRSGCGKTTLLNLAAGFLEASEGAVRLDGVPVTGPGADRAVVFQDDALYPWLSTRDNVAFPMRLRGLGLAERHRRADELLALVGLAEAAERPIWALSGGMRQRAGLARALAASPTFLLMDEPLGALDAMTRERMQGLLLDVWTRTGIGVLLITHDVEEALFLATRVVVMAPSPGRIVREFAVDFGRRAHGEAGARAVKSSGAFITAREQLLDLVHERAPLEDERPLRGSEYERAPA
jgi:taurine transport system ATP-binding protein